MIGLLLAASVSFAAQAEAPRVAVLPLEGPASAEQRAEVDALVRAEVTRLFGAAVLDGDATLEELASASSMGFQCTAEDTPCLTRLAILMRTEQVVAGTLSVDESGAELHLFVISAASAARLNEVKEAIPASGPARLQGIRSAVTLLLAPERVLGSVAVAVRPAGALVLIDGNPQGTAPLAPITGVRAGRHVVRVELEGYTAEERVIDLFAGTEIAVDVELQPAAGDSPDEALSLVDDAPERGAGANTLGLSILIAGGVGLVLGGGLAVVTGGAALGLDQAIYWTTFGGDYETRTLLLNAGRGFALAALVAVAIVITGGVATGTGLLLGGAE